MLTLEEAFKELNRPNTGKKTLEEDYGDLLQNTKIMNALKPLKNDIIKAFRLYPEDVEHYASYPDELDEDTIGAIVITDNDVFAASDHTLIFDPGWEPVMHSVETLCKLVPIEKCPGLKEEISQMIADDASSFEIGDCIRQGLEDNLGEDASENWDEILEYALEPATGVVFIRTLPDCYYMAICGKTNAYKLEQIEKCLDSTFYKYPFSEVDLELHNIKTDQIETFSAANDDTVDDVMKAVKRLGNQF